MRKDDLEAVIRDIFPKESFWISAKLVRNKKYVKYVFNFIIIVISL